MNKTCFICSSSEQIVNRRFKGKRTYVCSNCEEDFTRAINAHRDFKDIPFSVVLDVVHESNNKRHIPRKLLYIRQKGKCYYCKEKLSIKQYSWSNGPKDDNDATIEHIYSRYNPIRGKVKQKIVVACLKCNRERAIEDEIKFTSKSKVTCTN